MNNDNKFEAAKEFTTGKYTLRSLSRETGIPKSTLHNYFRSCDLQERNLSIYNKVNEVLQFNLKERYIRGGNATRLKYKKIKNN